MKTTGLLLLLGGTLAVCSVSAQIPPLVTEPSINQREREVFDDVKALMKEGNKLEALGILQDYLTNENAHSPAALFNVGNIYADIGEFEQAIPHYEAALAEYPDFLRARKLLTIVTAQQGEFAETVKNGEQYLAQFGDPGDDVMYGLLGLAYWNLKEPERAIDYYEVAVERDPKQKDWKVGLASSYMDAEQFENCIGILEQLVAEDPDSEDFLLYAMNAAFNLGDYDRGMEFLARAQAVSGVAMDSATPIDRDQCDVAPLPKFRAYPAYPEGLKKDGVEGRVDVEFTVTPEGAVTDVEIESASDDAFEASVLERVPQWVYEPGTKNGEPVSVRMKLPIVFKLGPPADETAEPIETADVAE